MKVQILAGVATTALALGTAAAFAQTPVDPVAQYDRFSAISRNKPIRPYDSGSVTARKVACLSDGSDPSYLRGQQVFLREPGYRVGVGSAQVGDGIILSYR